MKYPLIVTVQGECTAVIAENQESRDCEIRGFINDGHEMSSIYCYELGNKWTVHGFMLVNTPFPVAD
jgi:hypothetical protein